MAIPTIEETWADFNPDGSVKEPNKIDIRRSLRFIQAQATTNGMKTYPNKAVMDADLTQENGQAALLYADPVDANNYPTVWTYDDGTNTWLDGIDRIEPIREQQVIDGLRLTDLENESLPINFDDTNQFEIINTAISNPSTRYNWSVVGGKLVINQTSAVLLLIGFLSNYTGMENRSFSCSYAATVTDAASGFGICFNPSGGNVIDPTNHVSIVWRANNGLVIAYRQDGATVVGGLTAPGAGSGVVIDSSVPRVTWGNGDVLDMTLVLDADGTTGTFTTFKNGQIAASFRVTGLPIGYIGSVGRNTISTTMTNGQPLVSKVQQAAKRIYINPNVGASSIGTEANPFKTISDGLLKVNESGRRLDMLLKGGLYEVGAEVQTNRYDSISILGDQGRRPIIRPGTTLTSGWSLAAGSTRVRVRPHVWGGTVGSTNGSGAFIDLSQPDGAWGFALYTRLNPLTGSVAALEALADGVGGYWIDAANGLAFIKPKNNVDPNTLQIFRAEWLAGINLAPAPAGLAGMTDIHVAGIDIEFPYGHGVLASRVRGLIEDVFVKGAATLNAFSPNMMTGTIASCRGLRCFNDGINHTVPLDFAPPNSPERRAELRVIDAEMTDMVQGDGLSNHRWQKAVVLGGQYLRNGKCGIVPVDDAVIIGARIGGNLIGVQALASEDGYAQYVSVRHCEVFDNQYAFNVTASGVGASAVLEVLGGRATGSTAALIQMRNDQTTGAADGTNPCLAKFRDLRRKNNTAYRSNVTGAHAQIGFVDDDDAPTTPGAF